MTEFSTRELDKGCGRQVEQLAQSLSLPLTDLSLSIDSIGDAAASQKPVANRFAFFQILEQRL